MANTAVFGIYPTLDLAESAVSALKAEGFRATDISVLLPENIGSKDLAHTKASKAPEGASAGAGSGEGVRRECGLCDAVRCLGFAVSPRQLPKSRSTEMSWAAHRIRLKSTAHQFTARFRLATWPVDKMCRASECRRCARSRKWN